MKPVDNKFKAYLPFIGIGFELFALSLAGVYIGGILDKQFKLDGMGTIGLIVLLFISWLFHVIYLARQIQKNQEMEK